MIIIPLGNLLVQKRGQWMKEPFHFVITQIHWTKEGPSTQK